MLTTAQDKNSPFGILNSPQLLSAGKSTAFRACKVLRAHLGKPFAKCIICADELCVKFMQHRAPKTVRGKHCKRYVFTSGGTHI